jgi:hypothetical protein
MKQTRFFAYALVLLASLAASCNVKAQTLNWTTAKKFDIGIEPALTISRDGIVIEFHHGARGALTYYTLGSISGNDVSWGKTQLFGLERGNFTTRWPSVTVTRDNYVILMTSDGLSKIDSRLRYWVGRIQPGGGVNQQIEWLVVGKQFDFGYHCSVTVNRDGYIAEVHESGSNGKGMYYRLGHLENPNAGKYEIVWDSGSSGVWYDDGINPNIAVNDSGQVVEMHQVTGEAKIHYIRGSMVGKSLTLKKIDSKRYLSNDEEPAIALTNANLAIEVHHRTGYIRSAAGYLMSDFKSIDWLTGPTFTNTLGWRPAIATNGDWIVTDFEDESKNLLYSVARVP